MMKQRLGFLAALFTLGLFAASPWNAADGGPKKAKQSMVYELRTYTTHPGRLPALHARFRDKTMPIFEKHGIKNVVYWTPQDEELKDNTLVYVIGHESREGADKAWKAFFADPDWKKAKAESEADGPIVMKVTKQFLDPTDYSPLQ